jgi:hypothetical protein
MCASIRFCVSDAFAGVFSDFPTRLKTGGGETAFAMDG